MIRRLVLPEQYGTLYVSPAPETERGQSAAAHDMLQSVLPLYMKERGIVLRDTPALLRTEMGKPYFAGSSGMYVNLTHCRGLAAVLLSPYECGVDAETVRPVRERVVRRVFSDAEQKALAASDAPDRFFTRLWTLKEAYVKAIGVGISYPMREVEFTLGDAISCTKPDARFFPIDEGDFLLSVCVLTGAHT